MLLDVIRDPAERQLVVDCLVVIYWLANNNPSARMNPRPLKVLDILRGAINAHWTLWSAAGLEHAGTGGGGEGHSACVLQHAIEAIGSGFDANEPFARRLFFDLPASGREGSNAFLARACIEQVFDSSAEIAFDVDAEFCEWVPKGIVESGVPLS